MWNSRPALTATDASFPAFAFPPFPTQPTAYSLFPPATQQQIPAGAAVAQTAQGVELLPVRPGRRLAGVRRQPQSPVPCLPGRLAVRPSFG